MEHNNHTNTIVNCHSKCPTCNSDTWKSAKMIVMEGTTKIEGKITGENTDPGAFSGGTRNLLLSDRWFSWDQKIELEAELTSVNGLVEQVKRLMVAHAPLSEMPSKPIELPLPLKPQPPQRPSLVRIITPTPPKEPEKPKPPAEPLDLSWSTHFYTRTLLSLIFTTISILILYYSFEKAAIGLTRFTAAYTVLFFKNFGLENAATAFLTNNPSELKYGILALIFITIAFAPINFINAFSGNKQQKIEHKKTVKELELNYEKNISKYKTSLSEYYAALEKSKHQELENIKTQEIYNKHETEYKQKLIDYEISLKNRELEIKRLHDNHRSQLDKVMKHREFLWARARVCLRCGTGYIGSDNLI